MKLDSLFQHKIFSLFLALFTMALWGSLFPMVKLGYRAFQVDTAFVPDILLFAGLRFTVCGGLYVLLYSLFQHRFSAPPASAWPPVLWIGLFSIVLHYSFTYIGLAMNGGAKTAIVKQLGTLFAVCFGFLFQRGERFSWHKCVGGALGFASILLISLDGGLSFHFNIGEFLVMLASFCTVAAGAVGKRPTKAIRRCFSPPTPNFSAVWSCCWQDSSAAVGFLLMNGRPPGFSPTCVRLR